MNSLAGTGGRLSHRQRSNGCRRKRPAGRPASPASMRLASSPKMARRYRSSSAPGRCLRKIHSPVFSLPSPTSPSASGRKRPCAASAISPRASLRPHRRWSWCWTPMDTSPCSTERARNSRATPRPKRSGARYASSSSPNGSFQTYSKSLPDCGPAYYPATMKIHGSPKMVTSAGFPGPTPTSKTRPGT